MRIRPGVRPILAMRTSGLAFDPGRATKPMYRMCHNRPIHSLPTRRSRKSCRARRSGHARPPRAVRYHPRSRPRPHIHLSRLHVTYTSNAYVIQLAAHLGHRREFAERAGVWTEYGTWWPTHARATSPRCVRKRWKHSRRPSVRAHLVYTSPMWHLACAHM